VITVLIDSSTDSLLVALVDGDTVLAEHSSGERAQALLTLLDAVVRETGLTRADLARVVVCTGPGGFTGLRVGVATARGLAAALDLPIAGVSTLASVAATGVVNGSPTVVASVDAKRGELFVQRFDVISAHAGDRPDAVVAVAPFEIIAADDLASYAGDLLVCPGPPTAMGMLIAANGATFTTPANIVPEYGRDADAKPSAPDIRGTSQR